MASTPQLLRRAHGRPIALVALLLLLSLLGAACGATASWIPVESAEPVEFDAASDPVNKQAPAALAFVDDGDDVQQEEAPAEPEVEEEPPASTGFCTATANIWVHSAALNRIGSESNAEMNQVAMANVAEWLERATLFTEPGVAERAAMFEAFTELQVTVGADFDNDWQTFQNSTAYANHPAAQSFEAQRTDLVPFINNECDGLSISDLSKDAEARTDELLADFATAPSTITESDSLPGHSIFTHSSGRLIASFPGAWSYDEGRSDALVDFIASPKIDRFLNNEAIDGVRIQLFDAATLEDFRALIDESMIGSQCFRTEDLVEAGAVRKNITQSFDCSDHGASIIGQYNEGRGLGLIIEATFDRPDASRADLIRLASIANSVLWS